MSSPQDRLRAMEPGCRGGRKGQSPQHQDWIVSCQLGELPAPSGLPAGGPPGLWCPRWRAWGLTLVRTLSPPLALGQLSTSVGSHWAESSERLRRRQKRPNFVLVVLWESEWS